MRVRVRVRVTVTVRVTVRVRVRVRVRTRAEVRVRVGPDLDTRLTVRGKALFRRASAHVGVAPFVPRILRSIGRGRIARQQGVALLYGEGLALDPSLHELLLTHPVPRAQQELACLPPSGG